MINSKLNDNSPLVLDFDNSLIKSDLLFELLTRLFFKKTYLIPIFLYKLLFIGKSEAKDYLSNIFYEVDLILPIRQEIIEFINNEKKKGRRIYLVTGSNERIVKNYIQKAQIFKFDDIYGSDKETNLVGAEKTNLIKQKIGNEFTYVGDSYKDLNVWKESSEIIGINVSKSVTKAIKKMKKPFVIFNDGENLLKSIIKLTRIHQWAKNSLIFIPFLLSESLNFQDYIIQLIVGFFVISFLASSTYIVNDLIDLFKDRLHWSKKERPLASGDISIPMGLLLSIILMSASIIMSIYFLSVKSIIVLIAYYFFTTIYSIFLKKIAILDIASLALLFTIRIIFGVSILSQDLPFWLILFSFFIFSSLSIAKRLTELYKLKDLKSKENFGRGYSYSDTKFLELFGISFAVSSTILFSMYILLDAVTKSFINYEILILCNLIISIWLMRVWLVCTRGELNDDPIIFALKDSFSRACGLLVVIFVLLSKISY